MRKGAHTAGAGFCLLLGVGDIVVLNQFLVPGYVQQGTIHELQPAQQDKQPPAQYAALHRTEPPKAALAGSAMEKPVAAIEPTKEVEPPEPVKAPPVLAKLEQAQLQPPKTAERAAPRTWTVKFGHNSDRLSARATAALKVAVKAVKPGDRVRVEGHSNSVGVSVYNVDLSRRRARHVMSWLRRHGVAKDAIDVQWHGEDRPLHRQRNARNLNRRVEVSVIRP